MSLLLVCAALLAATQAPGARTAQAPSRDTAARVASVGDTARPVVQPPPTIIVEAPSQMPAVVFGIVGALLLAMQLWIMARQTTAMSRQTALLDEQAKWRRDEAVGTFYRVAHDLADEFRKANVLPSTPIPANYDTHPRQMLREAARLFAPLGSVVPAITEAALFLDEYFSAVEAYNARPKGRDGAARWQTVQALREQVGRALDRAKGLMPAASRWMFADGSEADFRRLCSMPPALAEAIFGGPSEET